MFSIKEIDLQGRIGLIETPKGNIETPAFFPVIHPIRQTIPTEIIRNIGFESVMTNSYIMFKEKSQEVIEKGIHSFIDFDGPIMTDSGGYQVLEYGKISTTPLEISKFQEDIGTNFANILDNPTGMKISYKEAQKSVQDTLESSKLTLESLESRNSLWMGPIQGGKYSDLVEHSAKETAKLDFDMFSIGSPTEMMESYNFKMLSEMIITAKKNLPFEKAVHLFGLGHPMIIPLAVALGCDTFDSASYILYAKEDRYMTELGTKRVNEIKYLPCVCEICSKYSIEEIKELEIMDKQNKIAIHNLYMLKKEMETTKQAIREGRLWEYIGIKARAHPRLWDAFLEIKEQSETFTKYMPEFKNKGLFLSSYPDNLRPEIKKTGEKLQKYFESCDENIVVIIPKTESNIFKGQLFYQLQKELNHKICMIGFISNIIGLIPTEIAEIYPMSQIETSSEMENDDRIFRHFVQNLNGQLDALKPKYVYWIDNKNRFKRVYEIMKEKTNIEYIDLQELEIEELLNDIKSKY